MLIIFIVSSNLHEDNNLINKIKYKNYNLFKEVKERKERKKKKKK